MSKASFNKSVASNQKLNRGILVTKFTTSFSKEPVKQNYLSVSTIPPLEPTMFFVKTSVEKNLIKQIKADAKDLTKGQAKQYLDETIRQIIDSDTPKFGSFHLNMK